MLQVIPQQPSLNQLDTVNTSHLLFNPRWLEEPCVSAELCQGVAGGFQRMVEQT